MGESDIAKDQIPTAEKFQGTRFGSCDSDMEVAVSPDAKLPLGHDDAQCPLGLVGTS